MKILLLGDASNYHATLATGLRLLGHDVTVASNGSHWQRTARDIDITRPTDGKIGGLLHYLNLRYALHNHLRGYDVVQISNPFFTELRPPRLRMLFDRLKAENRGVFLTALGTDPFYVKECLDPSSPIRYSEWRIGDRPGALALEQPEQIGLWTNPMMMEHAQHIYDNVDGVETALWEYHVQVSRMLDAKRFSYIGLPIDVNSVGYEDPKIEDKINLFLGRHSYRCAEKGTDLLEKAARIVVERHPAQAHLEIVEDKPYDEYCRLLRSAHVVLDQVYSYTPATNALIAMAMGKTAVSGAEPEFYDFIGERHLRPIINAVPRLDELVEVLDSVVTNPGALLSRARDSREFVEKHHDCVTVARRAADFWQKRLNDLRR